jgi:hypothetical protein
VFGAEPAAKALTAITGPWHRAALAAGWSPMSGRYQVTDLQRAGHGRRAAAHTAAGANDHRIVVVSPTGPPPQQTSTARQGSMLRVA